MNGNTEHSKQKHYVMMFNYTTLHMYIKKDIVLIMLLIIFYQRDTPLEIQIIVFVECQFMSKQVIHLLLEMIV